MAFSPATSPLSDRTNIAVGEYKDCMSNSHSVFDTLAFIHDRHLFSTGPRPERFVSCDRREWDAEWWRGVAILSQVTPHRHFLGTL